MNRDRYSIHTFIFATMLAVIGLNALQFATRAANPLVVSDGWSTVDTVIRKIPIGEFRITDLFIKRSALDHSQPLRKLITVWHYEYFDLDFGMEAVIGVLFAFINLGLLWRIARAPTIKVSPIPISTMLGFTAIAGVYLSLNSDVVFSWPLLTLAYTSHTFILLFILITWVVLETPSSLRLLLLFTAGLLMNTVTDDVGTIVTVGVLVAIVIQYLRGTPTRNAVRTAIAVIAACVLYKLAYAFLVPAPIGARTAVIGLRNLMNPLATQIPDMWKWAAIPLSASVVHRFQLHAYLGAHTSAIEIGVALVVFVSHIWFWFMALRGRRNLPSFAAISLMLMFYGLVVGILVARISTRGPDYLWQPRYVLIYEWNIVALLMMAMAQYQQATMQRVVSSKSYLLKPGNQKLGHTIFMGTATALLLLQIPLSLNSWQRVKYAKAYQQRMALQIGQLADHPFKLPDNCLPQVIVCTLPEKQRVRVLRFLKSRQLNLFSHEFQLRNRLYPDIGKCFSKDSARHSPTVASTCVN